MEAGVREECIAHSMTQIQAANWWMSVEGGGYSDLEAKEMWLTLLEDESTPRDNKGRLGALRLAVPVTDLVASWKSKKRSATMRQEAKMTAADAMENVNATSDAFHRSRQADLRKGALDWGSGLGVEGAFVDGREKKKDGEVDIIGKYLTEVAAGSLALGDEARILPLPEDGSADAASSLGASGERSGLGIGSAIGSDPGTVTSLRAVVDGQAGGISKSSKTKTDAQLDELRAKEGLRVQADWTVVHDEVAQLLERCNAKLGESSNTPAVEQAIEDNVFCRVSKLF